MVAKGFTQREWIILVIHFHFDFDDTFSPISSKDSFRIIIALVVHFNLKLHQIDVTAAFVNGQLFKEVYTSEPESFEVKEKEQTV